MYNNDTCIYALPVLCLFVHTTNFTFYLTGVSSEASEFEIPYDVLVVAVGSQTATYGDKDIEKYAHRLKNVEQAKEVRKNIMDAFETAAIPGQTEKEICRLLNFVVVGGGPTGRY